MRGNTLYRLGSPESNIQYNPSSQDPRAVVIDPSTNQALIKVAEVKIDGDKNNPYGGQQHSGFKIETEGTSIIIIEEIEVEEQFIDEIFNFEIKKEDEFSDRDKELSAQGKGPKGIYRTAGGALKTGKYAFKLYGDRKTIEEARENIINQGVSTDLEKPDLPSRKSTYDNTSSYSATLIIGKVKKRKTKKLVEKEIKVGK